MVDIIYSIQCSCCELELEYDNIDDAIEDEWLITQKFTYCGECVALYL